MMHHQQISLESHTHTHAYTRTHIYTYAHTHIHTHIHIVLMPSYTVNGSIHFMATVCIP